MKVAVVAKTRIYSREFDNVTKIEEQVLPENNLYGYVITQADGTVTSYSKAYYVLVIVD